MFSKNKDVLRSRFIALILALATALLYLPVLQHSFIIFDDEEYIIKNQIVQSGLTWIGVKWAFTTGRASNWHPLTWLSHMLDCQLFGLDAGAHHLVNALLHSVNAALLLLLLFRMTGALRQSAFVAALFAWHPLHVESVAWAAERKDVLSTLFGLLALIFYVRYAQKRSKVESRETRVQPIPAIDYGLALLFFACGLMSKPMLVTLPFVMLLLDYWPLGRVSSFTCQVSGSATGSSPSSGSDSRLLALDPRLLRRLALEKWPFFLLSGISCVVTFLAQRTEAVRTLERCPLDLRVGNAVLSYEQYLMKMLWPTDMAVLYPFPQQLAWSEVAMATAALAVISWVVWQARHRWPCLLVGWFWYLGMLVPVIGLVQVGNQAMADRYTYVPLVGVFIGAVYWATEWVKRFRFGNMVLAALTVLALIGCLLGTRNQLRFWRDNESLFSHAVAVTKNNGLVYVMFGNALERQGRLAEALVKYREILRFAPESVEACLNVGSALFQMGRLDEAMIYYQKALNIRPDFIEADFSIGNIFLEKGRLDDAIAHYERVLKARPDYTDALCNLGAAFLQAGRMDEAIQQYQKVVVIEPGSAEAHNNLGYALLQQGRVKEAMAHFRKSLEVQPDNADACNKLAWLFATAPDPSFRDGVRAVALAERANRISGKNNRTTLTTLAAAYAEAGRFPEAVTMAQRALELAVAETNNAVIQSLQEQIMLYQSRSPFHQTNATVSQGQP